MCRSKADGGQRCTGPRASAQEAVPAASQQERLLGVNEVITAAGVTDPDGLVFDLRTVCGITDPGQARFRRTTLSIDRARGWVCAPESYLEDGDEDGYDRATSLSYAYRTDADVPPVVFGWLIGDPDSLQVLDGLHRLSGAADAGRSDVPAFEVLPPA